ncbi:MAG: hypothetical protein CVV41_13235 [Candidatus Riflebacteria bacterium HGW-Riflebacteria-1]|nr:MAG: hypothetical protein CVV41_13235 [Candidatus Riflebacteria bacterium HGW-Riflebacteria-1]
MSLKINQNVLSLSTYSTVNQTASRLEKSIQKLSSGLRINSAADDAAGLAISEKMRRQIRGLSRAVLNAQDGVSMIQTAEGALGESHSILQRMRELAIQSSNDTLTSNDRLEIQKEVNQLKLDLDRIAHGTEFNTKKLLDGSQTALISASTNSVSGLVNGSTTGAAGNYDVTLSLISGGVSEMQRSQIFSVKDVGSLAHGGTQLQSIAQFYDSNGVFVLDVPQTLNVSGNGKSSTVTLDGQMTLDNLAAAIQNAMGSKSGLALDNSRVSTVNTAQTKIAGMGGYLQIVSGSIGEDGQVSFSSDQKIIDALGLNISREAVDNRVRVNAKDAYGNLVQSSIEGNQAAGLLNGIDVQFSSQAAQVAGVQGLEQGINLTAAVSQIVIGAGTGAITVGFAIGLWSLDQIARQINTVIDGAVAVNGLSASVVEGEIRLSYERPASVAVTVPNTISVAAGGTAGQISRIGFVDGTYSGFVDARKDVDNLLWGMSLYKATGAGAVSFSVGNSLDAVDYLLTLVAAVNVADMYGMVEMASELNVLLKAATVNIRIDQIGSTIAFTSTLVGKYNLDGVAALSSRVTVNLAAAVAGDTTFLTNKLGMLSGTAKGSGDSNFKMFVVDSAPQFQIGADQGQVMQVSMANMTAESLGVDKLDMTTVKGANSALSKINKAIDKVSSERSKLGSFQNRLEFAINNLRNTHSNLTASESRIRDADIALEMIEFTRNQIISQSGTAMLAQANMVPQGVLQLLA